LSNYATFLTEPKLAPLSIVMTALSTALAVVVTPLLTLLLLGKRLPIDLVGMISNITEIVVVPIGAGLFLNRCVHNHFLRILKSLVPSIHRARIIA
jgi:predicted Na+-dependent transporter